MKSYKNLDIFNEAKKLAVLVHKLTMQLPKIEMYEEGSQIRRSSKSIAAMIVEGYGRNKYKADFIKYLVYSHAECDETILHLDFLFETGSLTDKEKYNSLRKEYEILSSKINNFIKYVEDNWNNTGQ